MVQRPWLPFGPATAIALLAAAGLGIWSAERAAEALGLGIAADRRAGRVPATGAERRRPASTGVTLTPWRLVPAPTLEPAGVPSAVRAPDGAEGAGARQSDEERSAAVSLAAGMRKLVRDLEYNTQFPEPPQQTVVTPPEPWRPPPAAEAAPPAPIIEAVEPRRGSPAGGNRVTIRGKNLRPGQVMFGASPAQIVATGAGGVTVIAPRGAAGSVAIAVTNDDGAFTVAGEPFTYDGR